MELLGIGTDIVSIDRMRGVTNLERFCEYVLIKNEIEEMKDSRDKVQFIASRFASKEALIKAWPGTINYHDIETGKDGEKFIMKVPQQNPKGYNILASISHSFTDSIAIATVLKN